MAISRRWVLGPGARCPRSGCGGMLLARAVLTEEGEVRELACHLCARTFQVVVCQPYGPHRVQFRREVEASIVEKADGFFVRVAHGSARGFDHNEDSALPPDVLAAVRLYTGLPDECPPEGPPGSN